MISLKTWYRCWEKERLGLSMIAGSIAVIGIIVFLIFQHQKESALETIRVQGFSLARLVADVPYDQLSSSRVSNTLDIIYHSQQKSGLAYVALVDEHGQTLHEKAAPNVVIRTIKAPQEPSHWIGERQVPLYSGQQVLEFYAPVLFNSQLKGFVRIGYFTPGAVFELSELPFLAWLALLIFLLTPLFYGLVLREIRPLRKAHRQITDQMSEMELAGNQVNDLGGLSEFTKNFNDFLNGTKERIASLEDECSTMAASTKVAAYNHAKFAAILQSLPDGVMVLDQSGSVIFANHKVAAIFNTDTETILSEPLKSWCADDEIFRYIAKIQNTILTSSSPSSLTHKDDSNKTTLLSAIPIYSSDESHETLGMLIQMRDGTQASLAENYREEFVGHISHELKTPLNSLSMYCEALLGPDGEDKAFRIEGLNVIYDETERMRDLINNLLKITKIEMGSLSLDRQRVKLHDLLVDIFDYIKKSTRASDLEYKLELDDKVGDVAVDKTLLQVAITNLLTNAIKYNKPGGVVSLALEELDESVRIIVSDTGLGISEQDQQRIFDKFFRSEGDDVRKQSGHGLGLALAKDIVELHNGHILLDSELGKGTKFIIEFYKDTDLLKKLG